MPRIPEVDPSTVSPRVKATLDAQQELFGAPLKNHLLYAHNDDIFRGVRGVWAALDTAALFAPDFSALVNRRVAVRVGCVF